MLKWLSSWWTTWMVWLNADKAQRGMLLDYRINPDDFLEVERPRSRADD